VELRESKFAADVYVQVKSKELSNTLKLGHAKA